MSLPRFLFHVWRPLLLVLLAACGDGGGGAAAGDVGGTRAAAGSGVAGASAAGADARAAAGAPLRVLVLSGGGYHAFGANLDLLLAAVGTSGPFEFTRLRLGPDAPGAPPPPEQPARAALGTDDPRTTYDVVLACTQGELRLSGEEKKQLLLFVRAGGGFVGLHCAVDSHPGWVEYIQMCGGRFERHPPFGEIEVHVDVPDHPITAGLPATWTLRDEFYHLQDWEKDVKTVLMSGTSPEGGPVRPVAWCSPYGKGRVAVTILGHGPEVHGDPRYQQWVAHALLWSAGREAKPSR